MAAMHPEGTSPRASWPYVESKSYLWTWLFLVPLVAYSLWQALYFLIVNVLRRQRLLKDPEVMTSYRFPPLSLSFLGSCPFFHPYLMISLLTENSQRRHRKQTICGGA